MAETAIIDFNNPANGMKVNPDGSINTSGGGAITNDGTFAKESGGHLAAIDTTTAASKTDLDNLVTNTTGVATAANQSTANTSLSNIKTDLDEIATDTDNLAGIKTDLDTLAGVVSSSKAAVKAASGDFADGANVTFGAEADAASTDSTQTNKTHMSFLKGMVKIFADVWDSVNHLFKVSLFNGSNQVAIDGSGNLSVKVGPALPSGTNQIGHVIIDSDPDVNADVVLLASGTYSSNQTSANQANLYGKGVYVWITTGAFGSGASTIVVSINAIDPSSGATFLLLATVSLAASSNATLQIYPAISTTANSKLNGALPKTWNITVTAVNWGSGGSVIGVGASVIR